jgi:hypothetical protein
LSWLSAPVARYVISPGSEGLVSQRPLASVLAHFILDKKIVSIISVG